MPPLTDDDYYYYDDYGSSYYDNGYSDYGVYSDGTYSGGSYYPGRRLSDVEDFDSTAAAPTASMPGEEMIDDVGEVVGAQGSHDYASNEFSDHNDGEARQRLLAEDRYNLRGTGDREDSEEGSSELESLLEERRERRRLALEERRRRLLAEPTPVAYYDRRESYKGMAPVYCTNTTCNIKVGDVYMYPMMNHYCGTDACKCTEPGESPASDGQGYCDKFDFVITLLWDKNRPKSFIHEKQDKREWFEYLEPYGFFDSSVCNQSAPSPSPSSSSSRRRLHASNGVQPRTRKEMVQALEAQRRERAECDEEAEDDAPDNADAAVLRRDATNEELREFFARTPMIEPFSSNLDSIFAMNIDVNKLFVLAQVRGGRRTPRARLASNL